MSNELFKGIRVWLEDYSKTVADKKEVNWKRLARTARVTLKLLLAEHDAGKMMVVKEQTPTTMKMPFGKYKEYLISEVVSLDPDYVEWCIDNFDNKPKLVEALRIALLKDELTEQKRGEIMGKSFDDIWKKIRTAF